MKLSLGWDGELEDQVLHLRCRTLQLALYKEMFNGTVFQWHLDRSAHHSGIGLGWVDLETRGDASFGAEDIVEGRNQREYGVWSMANVVKRKGIARWVNGHMAE